MLQKIAGKRREKRGMYMHRRITDKRVNNFHHLNLMDIIQAFHSICGASLW